MNPGEQLQTKSGSTLLKLFLAAGILALLLPQQASACAACFGESGSPMAKGLSMGVIFLVGVVLVVLGGVAAFFVYLAWRARTNAQSAPEELGIPNLSEEDLAALGR